MLKQHHYEIQVRGCLGAGWDTWFASETIQTLTDCVGETTITVISGQMDHAGLHGILSRIRDLGLYLLSVRLIEPGPGDPDPTP